MKLDLIELYVDPDYVFKMSHKLIIYLSDQINNAIINYVIGNPFHGFDMLITISARSEKHLPDGILLKGPSVYRKNKQIGYVVYIPYEIVMNAQDRLKTAIEFIIEGIQLVLAKHNLNILLLEKDKKQFVSELLKEIRENDIYRYVEVSPFANEEPAIW